jgi:hypothetical protein
MKIHKVLISGLCVFIAGCYTNIAEKGDQETAPQPKKIVSVDSNNPCRDSLFLALRAKPLEKLTEREFEMLKIREQACADYQKQVQRGEQVQGTVSDVQDKAITVYIIGAIASIGLYYLLTQKQ